MQFPSIILASQSKYKRELISRLELDIEFRASDIIERQNKNESSSDLVRRLSFEKAFVHAANAPESWIIGSDQIAVHKNKVLGKPGNKANAIEQLKSFSGQTLDFVTGIALINKTKSISLYDVSVVEVKFKELSRLQIINYLDIDQPYDCAGSFKIESLGIALFDWVKSDDPTSLEGLSLITLCKLLRQAGIEPLINKR